MILPDHELRRRLVVPVAEGGILVSPLADGAVQPSTIDLRLGDTIQTFSRGDRFDPHTGIVPEPITHTIAPGGCWYLFPDTFALAATLEHVELPDSLDATLEGKSSLARVGLQIHTAGYVDAGWRGNLTVELKNVGPLTLTLRPGMFIAQIRFHMLLSACEMPYGSPSLNSKYQNSVGPVPARIGAAS